MSKNMTRKGLALGAGLGLLAGSLVGVPANAVSNTYLTTVPFYGAENDLGALAGAGYGMILKTNFKQLPSGLSATDLKYAVEVVTAGYEIKTGTALTDLALNVQVNSQNGATFELDEKALANAAAYEAGEEAATANVSDWGNSGAANFQQVQVYDAQQLAGTTAETDDQVPAVGLNNLLYIQMTTAITESIKLKVTPWVDNVDNNQIDSSEIVVGEAITITFVPQKDAALTMSFEQPVLGATTVTANASFSNLNNEMWFRTEALNSAADPKILFDDQATAIFTQGSAVAIAWDAVDGVITATDDYADFDGNGGAATEVPADTLFAGFSLDGTANATNFYASNTSTLTASAVVAAKQVDSINANNDAIEKPQVSAGAGVVQGTASATAESVDVIARADETAVGKLTFTSRLYKDFDATNPVLVGAGVVATVTVTKTALDADSAVTVTGVTGATKAISGATNIASFSFDLVTDSSGKISFEIVNSGPEAGDAISVAVAAEGEAAATTTVKWVDTAYTVYPSAGSSTVKAAIGSSVGVDFIAVDQFGAAPANAQIALTIASQSGDRKTVATRSNYSYNVALTNGRGSVTISDNGSATLEGTDNLSAQLQVAATAGGGYVAKGSAATFGVAWVDDFATATLDGTASNNGVLSGTTATAPIAIESLALKAWDDRFDTSAAKPAYDFTNGYTTTAKTAQEEVFISGNVKTSTGAGLSNVPVTLKADGLLFATGNGSGRYVMDQITVNTGAAGDYKVWVIGSLGGLQTVAISAAGKTASVPLTFAANTGAAAAMTLTTPASVADGKTADAVVKIVDKFGNAVPGVTVTFKETGPGYLNTTSGTTDADGEVVVNLITVAGDTGTSTITASATVDGKATSVVKTVTVGAAAASTEGKVNVGSFNGKLVVYALGLDGARITWKVGGNWGQDFAVGDTLNRFDRPTPLAGVTVTVDIFVDGVKRLTKSVVTR